MTIEQLDKSRVLISLKNGDMELYSISIDKLNIKDPETKASLKALLKLALERVGISTEDKAMLVEAMPHKEGMLILVTIDIMRAFRKTYRIKKPRMLPTCMFENAEGLLSFAERIKSEKAVLPFNSLWEYKNRFYIIFSFSGISPKAKAVLSEYALCRSLSLVRIARIKEVGRELLSSNAVDKIIKSMTDIA